MLLFASRGANHVVNRLFYTKGGSLFISVLFGFALATVFQKVCTDRKCMVIKAPPMKEIQGVYYGMGNDECYLYVPKVVPCNDEL